MPERPDASITKQLGYARLLYDQAVTQSFAPTPLNLSSVLTFHDVMEYLFVLAVAHVGEGQNIDLNKPFVRNVAQLRAVDSRTMSHPDAVDRVTRHRNAFKHGGALPGPDAIEQVRRDATAFLESNCPRYFGMAFGDITMIQIVPQVAVREHLQAARTAAGDSDIATAMSELAIGFDILISEWGQGKHLPSAAFRSKALNLSSYRPRPDRRFDRHGVRDSEVGRAIEGVKRDVLRFVEDLDNELESLRAALK